MTRTVLALAMTSREEGWVWWLGVVLGVALVALVLWVLRRRFLSPMPHRPSDTTDAWTEAGRRLQAPKEDAEDTPGDGKEPR